MTQSRFANLLIDTVSRLAAADTDADRWDRVCDIAGGIGATGANAGEIDLATRQPTWASYNMDAVWLSEYAEAGLHDIDPLLAGAMAGRVPRYMAAPEVQGGLVRDPRRRQFLAGLERHNYHYFCARGLRIGARYRVLVLASDRDPRGLYGPGTGRAYDAVAEVLLSHLSGAPQGVLGASPDQLYAAERDALSLMAQGMSLDQVAEKMRISRALLRVHLRQACAKLGVGTPDQAMAMALVQGKLAL